ncbi:MAG: photosynthetic reaction center cytochrome c subunit family protein [Vicinamibacterales bacterium]
MTKQRSEGAQRHLRGPLAVAAATVAFVLALVGLVGAQAPARVQMAEEVFKDIQVLRGIPADQFMGTMNVFSAAVGKNCTDCHGLKSAGNWANYADDTPEKTTARRMVLMMQAINKANFGGRQVVTCYTCHRTNHSPKVTPSLVGLYSPPPDEPDDLVIEGRNVPQASEIFDKYIAALGGAQKLNALTSIVGKGTHLGFGEETPTAAELYAKAPDQRVTIWKGEFGDSGYGFNGKDGWILAPAVVRPQTVTTLTGQDLDGAKFRASLLFPGKIAQGLTSLRVGYPTDINGKEVNVVQGTTPGGSLTTLFFDAETGLLVRSMSYADSPVGRYATQFDFSDFRDVAGVKFPFKWTETWMGGREQFQLTEVQANVQIPADRFAKPAK